MRYLFLAVLISLAACGKDPATRAVTAAEFGERWPLTVAAGTLECVEPHGAVVLHANGQTYALNGIAGNMRPRKGWRVLEEIWKVDEKTRRVLPPSPDFVPRVNVGPLLDAGLALCSQR